MSEKEYKNSHRLIFSEIKVRLNDQFDSIDGLDTKAGVTLGFVGAIIAGLINSSWFLSLHPHFILLIILPLTMSAIVLFKSFIVRSYKKDPEPKALIDGYKMKSEDETLGQLIRNYEDSFEKNKKHIKNKKRYLNYGFTFLVIAILALAFTVLIIQSNLYRSEVNQTESWEVNHHDSCTYQQ